MNGGPHEVKGQPGVIFFDAAGTLIHLVRPVGWHYAETARAHGLAADPEDMEAAFRATWQETPHRPPSGKAREDDDRPWWRKIALETLRRAVAPPPKFDSLAWFEDLYERFARPGVWALYDDVVPCLTALAPGSRLAVISNFDRRLRTILDELGVSGFFAHQFLSSEIGAEKPSGEIFRHAVRVMGISPADSLHVGDDLERDGAGARAAGLATFLVDRPSRTLTHLRELYV